MGFQIKQALIAIGSGGVFGRGFGHGVQKFGYLPEPHNDFIFAMIGEEWGFIGLFVIIGIVMALRFPRGGIGLVIGGGLLVFSVHYIGLTAGESLADRGHVTPWAAMWTPNIVLTVLGILGLLRVSRESGSTRGGDAGSRLSDHATCLACVKPT